MQHQDLFSILPTDALVSIMSYLSGYDLAHLSSACKALRDVVAGHDILWKNAIMRDFAGLRVQDVQNRQQAEKHADDSEFHNDTPSESPQTLVDNNMLWVCANAKRRALNNLNQNNRSARQILNNSQKLSHLDHIILGTDDSDATYSDASTLPHFDFAPQALESPRFFTETLWKQVYTSFALNRYLTPFQTNELFFHNDCLKNVATNSQAVSLVVPLPDCYTTCHSKIQDYTISFWLLLTEDVKEIHEGEGISYRPLLFRGFSSENRDTAITLELGEYDNRIYVSQIIRAELNVQIIPIHVSLEEVPLYRWCHISFSCYGGNQPRYTLTLHSSEYTSIRTFTAEFAEILQSGYHLTSSIYHDHLCDTVFGTLSTRVPSFSGFISRILIFENNLSLEQIAFLMAFPPPDSLISKHPIAVPEINLLRESSTRDAENTVHEGFGCDGCSQFPIRGTRWKCLHCLPSYDLCSKCHQAKDCVFPGRDATDHSKSHIFVGLRKHSLRRRFRVFFISYPLE